MYPLFLLSFLVTADDVVCTADEFQCSDKMCIDKLWQCDGESDCNDTSDEANCPVTNKSKCIETEWECHTGKQCIHISFRCDKDLDCLDGSDELDCEYFVLLQY
jgi:hypothetical protein